MCVCVCVLFQNVAADHVMLRGTRSRSVATWYTFQVSVEKTARDCLSELFCQKSHHDSIQ